MSNFKILNVAQDWNAQEYKKYAIPQFEIAMDALSKWDFSGNENVLDIGCGNGAITFFMAKNYLKNGHVTGIDLSIDMISSALNEFKADNLDFENLDASKISFKNKFDLVTSFYCIHWIKDKQKLIDSIANSLKQNGKMLIYLMCDSLKLKSFLTKVVQNVASSEKWNKYFPNYKIPLHLPNPESFKNMVTNSKLKILDYQAVDKELIFSSKDGLSQWINALPFVHHVPLQVRQELLSDISDVYLKANSLSENEPVKFYLPTIAVSAQKVA